MLKILTRVVNWKRELRRYLNEFRNNKNSIVCNTCGHNNQDDAILCDECGEELITDTLSIEEEKAVILMILEESDTEVSNKAEFDENSAAEVVNSKAKFDKTEEIKPSLSSFPINAATTLELDEPPIQKIASPTTIELLESTKAILIHQETKEKFILPLEEKVAYIGRLNNEFLVHIDLSNINNANLISRIHAAIHRKSEAYYLEDAGSTNGTWLNGQLIQPGTRFCQKLNLGDTIAFGRNQTIKFTFDLED